MYLRMTMVVFMYSGSDAINRTKAYYHNYYADFINPVLLAFEVAIPT